MEFFHSNGIDNVYKEYSKNGLFVLRVTIMNPYIHLINKSSGKNYFKEFMEAISGAAENYMIMYEKEERGNEI
jgi:hypothetical protein